MDPKQFAASTLQLLQAEPGRYVNFGMYWYFVKALMKRFYTRDNLYLLGDYVDQTVLDRAKQTMDGFGSLAEALEAAAEEYQQNAMFNLGSNVVRDADGEQFTLIDNDAGQ